MNEEIPLNKYQKNEITQRSSLDFFTELDKMSTKKQRYSNILDIQLDSLISKLNEKGVLFYSIVIDMPFLKEKKQSEVWETVHTEVEGFLNYIGSNIELIEFCYFSIEIPERSPKWQKKEKKFSQGLPNIIGIFGVRSMIGVNKFLITELKNLFILNFHDVEVNWLSKKKEIKRFFNHVTKQKNFRFHRFVNYSSFFSEMYANIANQETNFEDQQSFGQVNHFISKTMHVSGLMSKKLNEKSLIIYFIGIFFYEKGLRLHENKIYSRVTGFRFCWEYYCDLDFINKNYTIIFDFIKQLYPQQLNDFNITGLILNSWNLTINQIKKNNSFIPQIVNFDRVIEFRDGIFFINEKKFVCFDANINSENLNTVFIQI